MTDEHPAEPADRRAPADRPAPVDPADRRRTLTRRALVAGGGLAALSAVAAVAGCTTAPRPSDPTASATGSPAADPADPPAPAVTASGGPPIEPMTYAPDDALAGFHALRERVRERRLTIGVLGDSIAEGQGATTLQHAYPAQLRDRLRAAHPSGARGGLDYIASRHQITVPADQGFSFPGTTTAGGRHGWGRRVVPLTEASGPGTYRARMTSAEVCWWAPGLDAAITVRVDDGAPETVRADAGGSLTWTSPRMDSAEHEITVAWAGGKPELEGAWLFDGDETRGIHVIEGGNSGSQLWQLSEKARPDGVSTWIRSAPRFELDLWMPEHLINDVVVRTPEQVRSDASVLIELIRTVSEAPILFTPPYERTTLPIRGTTWADYIGALRDAASADPLADVFEIGAYIPRMVGEGASDPYGWMGPDNHPNDRGYARFAEVLAAKLTATPA
jgi:lysophospholipase L1-like esterase